MSVVRTARRFAFAALAVLAACRTQPTPTFAGSAACTECHAAEATAWRGSDHQRAFQVADSSTVLADFGRGALVHYGDTTRPLRRDDRWLQNAEAADGRHADFPVAFTFGVRPLQQYVAPLGRGRYGVLPAAWDTRPAEQGGQRWFHQRPEEPIRAGDELHWTARGQVWNYQCAECHVTDYRKGYVAVTDSFDTKWSELGVGCEACHGPASAHITEARRVGARGTWRDSVRYGFAVAFRERRGTSFGWDSASHRPVRSAPPEGFRAEVETCARCHARRGQVWGDYRAGRPILDTHRPALLEAPQYFADGQIREEVYEYGSFLQSRMYAAGVTCSDCHDPHSQRVRQPGNALCAECHVPARYDAPTHSFHRAGTPGSDCVDCHMAPRTYMVVDVRRDHSFRVPRPDVSERTGVPNACTGCHANRPARWASDAVARWYGPGRRQGAHFADAFAAAGRGLPEAETLLVAVASDAANASIVRATALRLLGVYSSPAPLRVIAEGLASPEPLLRMAAAGALEGLEPIQRLSFLSPLLSDSVRAVRLEAAAALAGVPADRLVQVDAHALTGALAEYRASQELNADQAWAWVNTGLIAVQQGHADSAAAAYQRAIGLDSAFVPGWVNLADLFREQGNDATGEALLRHALALVPGSADLHFARALTLVRLRRYEEAGPELERAAALAPGDPRIAAALAAFRARP